MKKSILILTLIFIFACEDNRLPENTYDVRKATSEKELVELGNTVIPGQVVSIQLEYLNQNLSLSASTQFDSGTLGTDEINIEIPEDFEFNYRFDANGTDIKVKLLNENQSEIFNLSSSNPEYKGIIPQGNYKLVIENNLEWVESDSSIIPVFIQPDYLYLSDFGNNVKNSNYLERDLFQLISVKKCEYCDLANGDSTVFGEQFYSEVSFRGANMNNSDFSNSYFENASFSSLIDNEINMFTRGHTSLNNTTFRYCNMMNADFSNTYDMNNVDFYFSNLFQSNLSNIRGRNIDFESTVLNSSTLTNVNLENASFIGAFTNKSLMNNSSMKMSDFTYGHFTENNFDYSDLEGSRLDNARFDSASALGTNFCLTSAIKCNFDSLKTNEETLCNPLIIEEEEEEDIDE